MDKYYPKNKDPHPKRRRDKANPYEIFTVGIETDSPHFYISFTDSQGVHICMEINRSLFELFDRFELDDLSHLNKVDKYYDRYLPYHIEGGDVLNLNEHVLAVGISQRTEAGAIDELAKNILPKIYSHTLFS